MQALKNLFFLLIVFTGMLCSCVAEDIVNPTPDNSGPDLPDGMPTTLKLVLSPNKVTTRAMAIGDEGNEYNGIGQQSATPDELYVGECAIVLFDADENDQPTAFRDIIFSTNPAKTATESDTLAWEVGAIPTLTGKTLVMVIANMSKSYFVDVDAETLKETPKYKTYDAYKSLVIQTPFPATYDPKLLIKTGERVCQLKKKEEVIEIPMTQLAARVDFEIRIQSPTFEFSSLSQLDGTEESSLKTWTKDIGSVHDRATAKSAGKYLVRTPGDTLIAWHCKLSDHETMTFEWNGREYTVGNMKTLMVEGLTIDSVKATTQWEFRLRSVNVSNIQPNITLGGTPREELGNNSWSISPDRMIQDSYKNRFYTYAKDVALEAASPLTITYDVDLVEVTREERFRYIVSGHALWLKNGTNNAPEGGWGQGNSGVDNGARFVMIKGSTVIPSGTQPTPLPPTYGNTISNKQYTVTLLPKGTADFAVERGYAYKFWTEFNSKTVPEWKEKAGDVSRKVLSPFCINQAGTNISEGTIYVHYTSPSRGPGEASFKVAWGDPVSPGAQTTYISIPEDVEVVTLYWTNPGNGKKYGLPNLSITQLTTGGVPKVLLPL